MATTIADTKGPTEGLVVPSKREGASDEGLPRRGFFGIFFLSLAILVMEIALTRMLSVVMWYHFAFVVISLAMLGLAASGLLLHFFPVLVRNARTVVPWCGSLASVATVGMLGYLSRLRFVHDQAGELFRWDVAVTFFVILGPFFFGGLAISAALSRWTSQVDRLYFWDLVGAGFGCILVVFLLDTLGAPAALIVAAFLFAFGAALFRRKWSFGAMADQWLLALAAAGLVWHLHGGELEPRHSKGVDDDAAKVSVRMARWNSYSRIRVLEYGPDSWMRVIDIDGNASTGIRRLTETASASVVRRDAPELVDWISTPPFAVIPAQPEVAIIGPGGGREIAAALAHGARVTGIELNRITYDLMRNGPEAEFSGHIYTAPGVETIHDEARSWIRRSGRRFDLIQATLVDTWAATASGAFALSENALYTVEAFEDFFAHLTDEGVVHFTRWFRDPPRESLRTVTLMVEVLRRRGIEDPTRHIVVLVDLLGITDNCPPYTSMIWSKSPLDAERLGRLEAVVAARKAGNPKAELVPVVWPGKEPIEDIGRFMVAPDRAKFIAEYRYDVSPTTDDQPFFFNTVRLADVVGFKSETYLNEQAVVVLVTVLITVTGVLLLVFALPFILGWKRIRRENGRGTALRLLYFVGLGLGFMLVEIPLLQRFGLYLGHPTYALTTILASVLVGTGLGSAIAGKLFGTRPVTGARVGLLLLVCGLTAMVVFGPGLLARTLERSITSRIGLTVALLVPLGVLMGFPFPLGIKALASRRPGLVAWAWGMNGAASVLASVLAVAIGMHAGFAVALYVGAAAYGLCLLTAGRLGAPLDPAAGADPTPAR